MDTSISFCRPRRQHEGAALGRQIGAQPVTRVTYHSPGAVIRKRERPGGRTYAKSLQEEESMSQAIAEPTITEHETEQIDRANATTATPVVFVHGLTRRETAPG
jgi:hypothetical protein